MTGRSTINAQLIGFCLVTICNFLGQNKWLCSFKKRINFSNNGVDTMLEIIMQIDINQPMVVKCQNTLIFTW